MKAQFFVDSADMRSVLNDLGRLGTDVTRKMVIRRALKTAGAPIKAAIEKNAFSAIMDHGQMAGSFKWRQGTVKRGYLSMFIRSIVTQDKGGGYLTKIFEDGTKDRYQKSGWWTGRIEDGTGKTTGSPIETKFIQRGFDSQAELAASSIINLVKVEVTKVVARSKKLNNK